jgi:hypothetical protein
MSDVPAQRASDAEREQTIALLRDHTADGRLTLEAFTDRMSTAYLARTNAELEQLVEDLPATPVRTGSRRKPIRFLLSVFGSNEREGRVRIGRRLACLMAFGNIDLDLRQATIEPDEISITVLGMFGAVDVYVPEGVEVDMHGLALFGHARTNGNDPPPAPGTPIVRVYVVAMFAGIDAWRVPIAWTRKTLGEVIRAVDSGAHRELEP